MGSNERHQQFTADMEAAGYEVRPYRGRDFYDGPAVIVEPNRLQDVIRAASIRVQWDNLGHDIVVYPIVVYPK
jgi:hypothetical protein